MISSVKIIFNNITNPNHDCLPSCCCQLLPVHNLYILFQPCKGTLLTPPSYKNQHSLSTLPRLAFYDLLDNKMEAEAVQTSPLINQMTLRVYFCGQHQTSFTWLVEGSLNELFIVSKLKGLLERCFFCLFFSPTLQVGHLHAFSATDGNIHNLSSDISFPHGCHEPKM